jgi:hypothetical protein
MSLSIFLEVIGAWAAIMFVITAVVSYFVLFLSDYLRVKSRVLLSYMTNLLGERVNAFYQLPQIQVLQPIQPRFRVSGTKNVIYKIPETIPLPLLVDSFLEICHLNQKTPLTSEKLTALVNDLPECQGKAALLTWIQDGHIEILEIRELVNQYIAGMLDQVNRTINIWNRSSMIVIATIIVLEFNADSFEILRNFFELSIKLKTIDIVGADPALVFNLFNQFYKGFGWGSGFPQLTSVSEWINFVLLKLIGLVITVVLASLGIDFWVEALKKLGIVK